jgi:hypothetical protein
MFRSTTIIRELTLEPGWSYAYVKAIGKITSLCIMRCCGSMMLVFAVSKFIRQHSSYLLPCKYKTSQTVSPYAYRRIYLKFSNHVSRNHAFLTLNQNMGEKVRIFRDDNCTFSSHIKITTSIQRLGVGNKKNEGRNIFISRLWSVGLWQFLAL